MWHLIVRNTGQKCLQQDVFRKVSEKNPVVCYDTAYFPGPKKSRTLFRPEGYESLDSYWYDFLLLLLLELKLSGTLLTSMELLRLSRNRTLCFFLNHT